MREYWTYIDNFFNNAYEISNFGRVRNISTHKILKLSVRKDNGCVTFKGKRKGKQKSIHIAPLVYKYFSQNEPKFNQFKVYHIDNDKTNCHIDNLIVLESTIKKPTIEQEDLYVDNAPRIVKCIIMSLYKEFRKKGFDLENLEQESLMLIYKYLPNFKIDKEDKQKGFYGFCKRYVKYAFLTNYNKAKNEISADWII